MGTCMDPKMETMREVSFFSRQLGLVQIPREFTLHRRQGDRFCFVQVLRTSMVLQRLLAALVVCSMFGSRMNPILQARQMNWMTRRQCWVLRLRHLVVKQDE